MAKLKVWGGYFFLSREGQGRAIVAATSQKEAARIIGVSVHELQRYWSVTGNPAEIKRALKDPGVLLVRHDLDPPEKAWEEGAGGQ